ncbi:MAG TPA: VOC family protein [Thermoleophilia bacterium]|nr:VOC family protein [Thermoleophilia bacterium]
MAHAVSWFEIPATDFERAKTFYEKIFGFELAVVDTPVSRVAMFPSKWQEGEIGGSITAGEGYRPAADGPVLYLNAVGDLDGILERVPDAGGQVVLPKTRVEMTDTGEMALFMDSEGNRIGLYSV